MNDSLITFSGWVGSQVDAVRVGDGVAVTTFRVGSTPRRLRNGQWENGETLWYSVKAWRGLATNVAASLRVGDPVVVTGRLVAETWTSDDGTAQSRHVVVAIAVGHDLNRGTSAFTRAAAGETGAAGATDEGGPVRAGDRDEAVVEAQESDDSREAA